MNKKGIVKEKDKGFQLSLIIGSYLVLDVILLFIICLIDLNGVSHNIMLAVSFICEFLMTLWVVYKGNIKSALIFFILLLATPAFLNVLSMAMIYFTSNPPFAPVMLLLFRSGYTLDGELLNTVIRVVITFRIPALMALLISGIMYLMKK